MSNDHIKYLKSMMEEDLATVESLCGRQISPRPQSTRNSFTKLSGGGNGVEGAVSRVLRESIINPATGKLINVAKVFVVTPENLPYQDVGWVHRSCVNNCMICNAPAATAKLKSISFNLLVYDLKKTDRSTEFVSVALREQ